MTNPVFERIQKDISENDVVLYMKGSQSFPQCGFSAAVASILQHFEIEFKDFDILKDAELRQGIKDFSQWPTIPQLYVKGEFIGGCDIVKELTQSGELFDILKAKGVSFKSPVA
ncbi:MAG: Grx4 family monothiol glutaredoxin [Alphaproteobacteria bacterium]|nr:Grx4 family monothiol glutaredoxin [Alphaproteobacteria bacterium]